VRWSRHRESVRGCRGRLPARPSRAQGIYAYVDADGRRRAKRPNCARSSVTWVAQGESAPIACARPRFQFLSPGPAQDPARAKIHAPHSCARIAEDEPGKPGRHNLDARPIPAVGRRSRQEPAEQGSPGVSPRSCPGDARRSGLLLQRCAAEPGPIPTAERVGSWVPALAQQALRRCGPRPGHGDSLPLPKQPPFHILTPLVRGRARRPGACPFFPAECCFSSSHLLCFPTFPFCSPCWLALGGRAVENHPV